MKVIFFSTQSYDKTFFELHNKDYGFTLEFLDVPLNEKTAALATGAEAVCVFVNDKVNAAVLEKLATQDVRLVALRCAGFNQVDLAAAARLHMPVVRVPAYSPHAVAEHAVAMLMTLNRKIHKAYNRIREQNFSLAGLLGFDLYGKTVAVIGTGNIGQVFCKIMLGFGCRVLAFDVVEQEAMKQAGVTYAPLHDILPQADILSLHCPLNEHTRYLINHDTLDRMKKGAMLINTSRGGLIDTRSVIRALKSEQLGALAIDVYEQEESLFFRDLSDHIITDDVLMRLMSFPNVLVTAHQGFFTQEALTQIAQVTLGNLKAFVEKTPLLNEVKQV
ncbi:2-hydroxyacid dehydrogenase [Chryseolinea lacunae]|uniref:2-hydroxyacid dehydrogenase n=1 Tax=Chryseolinea lacunae TaxID=2801331 RepID=A0ABS1KS27_9BACT|nr:2-hydroxyacid dehydrogenase [Chryseolinea lacunae]MBL0742274.1 2-hydroxyacid dehydrogenase [Chryseolinea lacunae]